MLKLALATIIFLISLLTIFKAPAYFLWLVTILVDEFPWLTVGVTMLLLLFSLRDTSYQLVSNVLLVLALFLFLSPVVRANRISGELNRRLMQAFGHERGDKTEDIPPFQAARMFSGNTYLPYKSYVYEQKKNKQLSLDYYASEMPGARPCVIVVHGGSWKSGDNKQLPELNSYLAKSGYHVAAINYRLAPEAQSPAPVEDVKAAIAYLKSNSTRLNIDPDNLVLLGRSAGAQIALLAAYTIEEPAVKGIIDFYGPADMVWGYSIPSNPFIMNSRKVMEDYLGGNYQSRPQNFKNSSPLLHVSKNSPPTLIIHGENDVLVAYEHSKRLNQKLQEYGVKHYFLTLPWGTHGFDYNLNGPGGQISTYAVMYFLRRVTRQA